LESPRLIHDSSCILFRPSPRQTTVSGLTLIARLARGTSSRRRPRRRKRARQVSCTQSGVSRASASQFTPTCLPRRSIAPSNIRSPTGNFPSSIPELALSPGLARRLVLAPRRGRSALVWRRERAQVSIAATHTLGPAVSVLATQNSTSFEVGRIRLPETPASIAFHVAHPPSAIRNRQAGGDFDAHRGGEPSAPHNAAHVSGSSRDASGDANVPVARTIPIICWSVEATPRAAAFGWARARGLRCRVSGASGAQARPLFDKRERLPDDVKNMASSVLRMPIPGWDLCSQKVVQTRGDLGRG